MNDDLPDDVEIPTGLVETPANTTLTYLIKSKTGEKTKEGLLHILDDSFSDYSEIDLTPEESIKFNKTLKRLSTGASTFSVMNCKGAACHIASRCELAQMGKSSDRPHGKAPVNSPCVLEATIMRDSMSSYLKEYQINPENFTEVNIVAEMAEIETLLWRINMSLSDGSELLVIDQTIGFDRSTGQAITQQQVAPLFEQKQKLLARKSKLVKLMVGDRQEKYKKESALKQKPQSDSSSQMSAIRRQLGLMEAQLKKSKKDNNIIEGEVLTPEQLIEQHQDNPEEK
jgi:hypothetical protein